MMRHVFKIGTLDRRGVFVEIELRSRPQGPALSICGSIRQRHNSCIAAGQIVDDVRRVVRFAPGWDAIKRDRLVAIWERWHLNDLRAECEHQRARGWDAERIDPTKDASWAHRHSNLKRWLPAAEGGYLGKPCPECGYRYGTSWLYEPLPDDVLAFLAGLGVIVNQ